MKKKLYEGMSESGKTNSIKKRVLELIKENKSMLILDTKKEYESMFKNTNYEIIKFDLTDLDNSFEYNPLCESEKYYKNGEIDKSIDNITFFGNLIFKSNEICKDPFWDDSAKSMFIGICLYLLENNRHLNLKEVIKVSIDEMDSLKKYINDQDVLSPINIISSNIINSPSDTKAGIMSVLGQKIRLFAHKPALLNKISSNKYIDIKNNNQAIILTNFGIKSNYNILIEVALINLINKMIESTNDYTVILDNYDSLEYFDEFTNLFKTYLSDNIECIVGVRDNSLVKPLDEFLVMYRKGSETK